MGRDSTGAWTVYESKRLEMSYLVNKGLIKKNHIISVTLNWTNDRGEHTGSIGLISDFTENNCHLRLFYTIREDGEQTDENYQIDIAWVKSNLGKGEVLYFVCPYTRTRCRILYMAYGSPIFKARKAYKRRLYYDGQIASKLWKYNDSYWRLEKYMDKLRGQSRAGKRVFRGNLTKAALRFNRLYKKQLRMDQLRFTVGVPKALKGFEC